MNQEQKTQIEKLIFFVMGINDALIVMWARHNSNWIMVGLGASAMIFKSALIQSVGSKNAAKN